MVGRNQCYDEILSCGANESRSGPSSRTLSLGSESNGEQSQTRSPKACKTPEQQQESAYMQPVVSQPVEPWVYLEAIRVPQQAPVFDFDFDSGAWVSTEAYAHLPKDHSWIGFRGLISLNHSLDFF